MNSSIVIGYILLAFFGLVANVPVGRCPAETNQIGTFLADSHNCAIFYKCGNYARYVCNNGLHFSTKLGKCTLPLTSECRYGKNIENSNSEESIEFTDIKLTKGNCPFLPCTLDLFGLYPHPNDCDKFCECRIGAVYEMECPSGYHFNKNLKICDSPSNSGCNIKSDSSASRESSSEVGFLIPEFSFQYEISIPKRETITNLSNFGFKKQLKFAKMENKRQQKLIKAEMKRRQKLAKMESKMEFKNYRDEYRKNGKPNEKCLIENCPNQRQFKGSDGNMITLPVYFAHPDSVEKYCVCNWGKAYTMNCPKGFHFNIELMICYYPKKIDC